MHTQDSVSLANNSLTTQPTPPSRLSRPKTRKVPNVKNLNPVVLLEKLNVNALDNFVMNQDSDNLSKTRTVPNVKNLNPVLLLEKLNVNALDNFVICQDSDNLSKTRTVPNVKNLKPVVLLEKLNVHALDNFVMCQDSHNLSKTRTVPNVKNSSDSERRSISLDSSCLLYTSPSPRD